MNPGPGWTTPSWPTLGKAPATLAGFLFGARLEGVRNPPSHILPSHHACTGSVVGFQACSGIWEFAKTRTPNDTEQSTKTFEEESLDGYDVSMMILFQTKNFALHIHNPPPFCFKRAHANRQFQWAGAFVVKQHWIHSVAFTLAGKTVKCLPCFGDTICPSARHGRHSFKEKHNSKTGDMIESIVVL